MGLRTRNTDVSRVGIEYFPLLTKQETRKSLLDKSILLYFRKKDQAGQQKKSYAGKVLKMSQAGMMFYTKAPLDQSDLILFSVYFSNVNKAVSCEGIITGVHQKGEENLYEIKFSHALQEKEKLVQVLRRLMTHKGLFLLKQR